MKVDGKPYRTIRPIGPDSLVEIIDQTRLPHGFETAILRDARGRRACHQRPCRCAARR